MPPQTIYRTVDSILHTLNNSVSAAGCYVLGVTRKLDKNTLNNFNDKQSENNHVVASLLKIYEKTLNESKSLKRNEKKRHPLIVLEGLDGCGKSTICKILCEKTGAALWRTPPKSILEIRDAFDDHPVLRTAYYALGNYIAALEVDVILQEKPVIMDRYWHSTSAFAIAQSVHDYPGEVEIPPEGDDFYKWPEDLMKPDYVFYLDVTEANRKLRLRNRKTSTTQEKLLVESELLRINTRLAYRNMLDPQVIFINANFSKTQTVQAVAEKISHLFN